MTVAPKSFDHRPAVQRPSQADAEQRKVAGKKPEDLVAKLAEVQQAATREVQSAHIDSAAATVLSFESALRRFKTFPELAYFIADEARALLGAHQVCVVEKNATGKFIVKAVSSISVVDRSAPVINWFERLLAALAQRHDIKTLIEFDADAFEDAQLDVAGGYPLGALLWVPFVACDGQVCAGMLLARAAPWTEKDKAIATYVAGALSHTWQALRQMRRPIQVLQVFTPKRLGLGLLGVTLLGFLPVPMTALAPAEVVPRNPFVVTSGVAGVVEAVFVEPNERVKPGDVLARLNDTVFRNKYEVAKREVLVAEARYKKASQLAFRDSRGRHDLGVTQAELQVKIVEQAFAKAMLERTKIKAGVAGVATFSDPNDLVGMPLNIGEKIMVIANPEQSEFRIELPVSDSIVLKSGTRVKVFLDSDPLHPVNAHLIRADYRAKRTDTDTLAFRLVAQSNDGKQKGVRLGVRGTAQVYSDNVPLAYYLFRRPLGVLRQWLGL